LVRSVKNETSGGSPTGSVGRAFHFPTAPVAGGILVPIAIVAAIGLAFLSTWFFLSPFVETVERRYLTAMIIANVAIALGFIGLVGSRIAALLMRTRNQQAGSRTHLQLASMFALVAVAPSIIAFLFAFTILRTSLNDVFSDRLERYQETARGLANNLVEVWKAVVTQNMTALAIDISNNEDAGVGLSGTPVGFREYLLTQARIRGYSAIILVDNQRRIVLNAAVEERPYNLPSRELMTDLLAKPPGAQLFGVNDDSTYDMFRAAMRLPYYGGGVLLVYQPIDDATRSNIFAVRALRTDWEEAQRGRSRAESVFLAGYLVLATIILSGAVWLALWAATRIVRPIGRLIGMAERVSAGDLGARVEVQKNDGELGALARAMNHMTAQLQTQRDDLIETNRQFDRRRRFTEAVLSGVSAGVVGVSATGKITIANQSAAEFLGVDAEALQGRAIADVIPEFAPVIDRARDGESVEIAEQIEVRRNDRPRTVAVQVAADQVAMNAIDGGGADREQSYIVTFDDITQLISAQRNAAWGDVARRIAHEIKNPLTPIQLSAERLRRKYRQEITSNPEIFEKCTETIIRHVSDIGRMVDEFSSFARMPKPVIAREDLRDLARTAIFPQRVAWPEIDFVYAGPDDPVFVRCDGRLIVQALSNLLKNAGESISARLAAGGEGARDGRIRIAVTLGGGAARVDVFDNGVGLPKAERHRLTEPYMTTRAKGTGLGLAIVKKVIEEHGGSLSFDDDQTLGPTGARVSLILPADKAGGQEQRTAAAAAE
jgi:two-component system nitrogen regulation sensor histidine kinase NtrY